MKRYRFLIAMQCVVVVMLFLSIAVVVDMKQTPEVRASLPPVVIPQDPPLRLPPVVVAVPDAIDEPSPEPEALNELQGRAARKAAYDRAHQVNR